ncbi:competence protein ComK [Alkalihalobacillus sp. CinArs1]|uniref:competence protein ComK n=1 Tax=Alkalihalobacillus sp. CinArs1 TaxID=2995314 RepID=UPI0022DD596E|nr:competence protein ComK [Alkalihalobacillus sp. CinArs1]
MTILCEEMVLEYEISRTTEALLPAKELVNETRIYDRSGVYLSKRTQIDLIRDACLEGGSTYEGRRKAMVYHLKYEHQTPIVISTSNGICAFPTESPDNLECSWIFYHHVRNMTSLTKNSSMVHFHSGLKLEVPVSLSRLQKQMERMGRCISHYSNNPVYC